MNKTAYYELNLPDDSDFFDVQHQNENTIKIDSELKQKDINLDKHTNNKTLHLTAEEKEKLNSALPTKLNGTANRILILGTDNKIFVSDIDLSNVPLTPEVDTVQNNLKSHADNAIVSESGTHGMRYFNEKFQVYNGKKWVDVISELEIPFCVNTNNENVTITVTDGVDTFTANTTEGYANFVLPRYATWTVTLKDNNTGLTKSKTVNITSTVYTEVDLDAFSVTFNCFTDDVYYGDTIYVKDSSGNILQTFVIGTNSKTFTLYKTGAIYVSLKNSEGILSKSTGFNVIASNNNQTIDVNFTFNEITLWVSEDYNSFDDEEEGGFNYTITGTDSNNTSFTIEGRSDNYIKVPQLKSGTQYKVVIECKNYIKTFYCNSGDEVSTTFWKTYSITFKESNEYGTYQDTSTLFTRGSEKWQTHASIFQDVKQVLMDASGNEYTYNAYFDDDGYVQVKINGLTSYNNNTHRFMTKIPKMGYKIETASDGYFTITLTRDTERESDGFCYDAFMVDGVMKDYLYIGQFLAVNANSKLTSYYGMFPTENLSLSTFRTYANNIGSGWRLMNYHAWTLIQCMFLMYYGTLNSQKNVGQGYVNDSDDEPQGLDAGRLIYPYGTFGNNYNDVTSVSFMGITDIYGNLRQFLDGCTLINNDGSYKDLYVTTSSNNTNLINPEKATNNVKKISGFKIGSGYLKEISKSVNNAFVPKTYGSSSSTYFCDYVNIHKDPTKISVGGDYNDGYMTGIFGFYNDINSETTSNSGVGARLMFYK